MSHRKFSDRDGNRWEVRISSKADWCFEPVPGNPSASRRVRPPLYAGEDPFELSEQELQSILGDATEEARSTRPSPFGDYEAPKKKKSPFLDDR